MMPITDNDLALFRERAKTELESTGDIGRLAWDDVVEALCKEVARLRSASKERGDAAKLREALALIATIEFPHNFQNERFDIADACQDLTNAIKTASAALSAPPRNCDMQYNDRAEMYDAFKDWCNARGHTMDPKLAYDAFEWLLAQAAEKEGGKDGNE